MQDKSITLVEAKSFEYGIKTVLQSLHIAEPITYFVPSAMLDTLAIKRDVDIKGQKAVDSTLEIGQLAHDLTLAKTQYVMATYHARSRGDLKVALRRLQPIVKLLNLKMVLVVDSLRLDDIDLSDIHQCTVLA